MSWLVDQLDSRLELERNVLTEMINGKASGFKIHNQKHLIEGLKIARDMVSEAILKEYKNKDGE